MLIFFSINNIYPNGTQFFSCVLLLNQKTLSSIFLIKFNDEVKMILKRQIKMSLYLNVNRASNLFIQ